MKVFTREVPATSHELREGAILIVDKPFGWTSFQVVKKIRYYLKKELEEKRRIKVGHAGTLDPRATGILIIGTGKGTKQMEKYQAMKKTYIAEIEFGAVTESYDLEKPVEKTEGATMPAEYEIRRNIDNHFKGTIYQTPPQFSAIKKDGKIAYKEARKGKKIYLEPRKVEIHRYEIIRYDPPVMTARIDCGKGTYIRTLAHDLGQNLKSGAYLKNLKRTGIGKYNISDAWDLNDLLNALD